MPRVEAAPPDASASALAAVFVKYYGALQKERWAEAFRLLDERLKKALQVKTPRDLALRSHVAQLSLIDAFKQFDHIDVARLEVDLTSIKATVRDASDGNVAGEVVYDLVVFPKGPGRPLMYRVVMDAGLAQGQIIRLTQSSITRIDPGAIRDVM